jgi:aspartate-semialdehyde dehydrogenase
MVRVGFIGWRGMVGSVLMGRMTEETDFTGFEPHFFTTSNVGGQAPDVGMETPPLQDAYNLDLLKSLDVVVTCQGGGYTNQVYPDLRKSGWKGYWIDSSSTLRLDDGSIIILDPVNRDVIDKGLSSGIRTFVGGNCTVSLMLMALVGLLRQGHVEWISTMTYQAASGAGAKNMKELIAQIAAIGSATRALMDDPASTAIAVDARATEKMRSADFPVEHFGAPLAASLIPWIDSPMATGQTREEWKGAVETNKILQADPPIPIDGLCVRVGAMRCHSQGFTIKLAADLPLDEITAMLAEGNDWVRVIPNDKDSTLTHLTPAAVNGTLSVPVGRLRKMLLGPRYLAAFSVGDQLLWGAAEPIRRILRIILEHLST